MGFKGSLDSINLADIFQNLAMNQQTGTLSVSDGERAKSIYFQRGEVRYLAHGGRKSILLGEMLTGRGIATHEQVQAALAEQKTSGRLLGEIIANLGICTRGEIDDLVRFQVEEEIYDLFSWERAEFEFTEGPAPEGLFDPEQQATELAIDTSRLIMEAARRIDEWERIRQVIPSMDEVFVATTSPELLPEGSSPVAARILTYLDGTRSIREVVADSYFSRFEVAASLVAMLGLSQARRASADELRQGANLCMQQGKPSRAVSLMEQVLAAGTDDPILRHQLAEACISLGEKNKAAIHLNVLGDARQLGGDLDGAAIAYRRITEILPSSVAAHEKLARLKARQGENEEALKHYANLVQAMMEAGRLDEAAARCREGLKIDQESTDLRSALAKVLLSSGDKEGAIDEFERLAEVFARSGQARPAAEVFRRILQIDPRNRHAKRRLKEVLAGTGVKHESSHALRNVLIVAVLVLLGLGGFVVIHEMAVQTKFGEAEKRSQELREEQCFDEARAIWQGLEKEWSIFLDFGSITTDQIDGIDAAKAMAEERRKEERRRGKEEAERFFKEVAEHEKAHEIELFRSKIKKLLDSKFASEDLKSRARSLSKSVDARERAISEFLEWRSEAVAKRDIHSLQEEYRRTTALHSRYPDDPKLKDLSLPILVETIPPGANVFFGGAFQGTAPLVQRYPIGKAPSVHVEMPGYAAAEEIEVRDRVRVEVKLRRAIAWRHNSGSPVTSLTEGPGGTVLVTNQEGVLAALDTARVGADTSIREAVWTYRTGDFVGILGGVAVEDDTAYFGTDRLYALDLTDRQRRWFVEFAERGKVKIQAPPTVGVVQLLMSQKLVFGTYNDARKGGTVWAAYDEGGRIRWSKAPSETCSATRCRPLYMNERLFVPFMDGRVYELEVVDGKTINKWPAGAPSSFVSSLVLEGRLAWLVSGDGGLYGLDLSSKPKPPRRFDAGRAITTDLVVADEVGYFGDERGQLHAIELRTLARAWRPPFSGEGRATAAPVVAGERVYFATSTGRVYALNRADGKPVWDYRIGGEVDCLHFTGRFLLAGAQDGIVYAFNEEVMK